MEIVFGGVRGTRPVVEATHAGFGGDTTCVRVCGAEGAQIILDAGTGLRNVDAAFDHVEPVLLLLTHYHLDHVIGLPSCSLLYQPGGTLEIAAPRREGVRVSEAIGCLLSAPFWPVPMHEMPALRFSDLPDESAVDGVAFGSLRVRWAAVHHRNGCHAYRIDEPSTGASFVFATDVEWPISTAEERAGLVRLCSTPTPCTLLAMDGQWSDTTYPQYRDWGHSRWEDVVEVARVGGADRALVTHHAPDATDVALDAVAARVAETAGRVGLARQGMVVKLGGKA